MPTLKKQKGGAREKTGSKETPRYYAYEGPLKRAIATAEHYGFRLIEPIKIGGAFRKNYKDDEFFVPKEEKTALLQRYIGGKFSHLGNPTMVCYTEHSPFGRTAYLRLDIIGSGKSIADALVIAAAVSILRDDGAKNICLDFNNAGDRDSYSSYLRDLAGYYRKHLDEIDARCRECLKKDPVKLLSCQAKKCLALREGTPKSISYLSEPAREHFKEVLEFVEEMDTAYRIEDGLVSNPDYCSKTIFEVKKCGRGEDLAAPNACESFARGCRYDSLSRKIGFRKNIPSVGISIKFDNVPKSEKYKIDESKKKALVYFIQIGFEAKLKSLRILEMLRRARVPVAHSLVKDDLGNQLLAAEKAGVPFVVIMGQKEVMEGNVMVRNMNSRSQETVKAEYLGEYLKKLV